jgi:hypothetical protein
MRLTYLTPDGVDEDPDSSMNQLLGCSITYRIANSFAQTGAVTGKPLVFYTADSFS